MYGNSLQEKNTLRKIFENKMGTEYNYLWCTTYNVIWGTKYITYFGDSLFVTPAYGPIKKSIKIDKKEIRELIIKKRFWLGSKFSIVLKSGKVLKYYFVNRSWIPAAEIIVNEWFKNNSF